jgi:hypothetical protein
LALGSDEFVAWVRGLMDGRGEDQEVPQLGGLRRTVDLAKLATRIADRLHCDTTKWGRGRRSNDASRMICAYLLSEAVGARQREIAEALGYGHPSSVGAACRLVRTKLKSRKFRKRVEDLLKDLRRYSLFKT